MSSGDYSELAGSSVWLTHFVLETRQLNQLEIILQTVPRMWTMCSKCFRNDLTTEQVSLLFGVVTVCTNYFQGCPLKHQNDLLTGPCYGSVFAAWRRGERGAMLNSGVV